MNLKECIENIDNYLTVEQKEEIKAADELVIYDGLLRRIRNRCDLWTDGTREIEEDIYFLIDNGYQSKILTLMLLEKISQQKLDTKCNLDSPGNCSLVILEIYHDYLRGNLPINLLDR